MALGKAPSAIALAARTLAPPTLVDDQALYERRALSMTWTRGRRELVLSGRLPLEQGTAFEQAIWNIAKPQRALDKQAGTSLEWQQYTADALVTLARSGGTDSGAQAQPHHSDRAPQRRCSRRYSKAPGRSAPRQPSDSPATHAASPSNPAAATSCTRASAAAPPTPSNARSTNAQTATASTPAAPPARELEAHHLTPAEYGGKTELDNLILLCPRHHKHLHDHHIHTNGTGDHPAFTDASRTRHHHQPATRTTPLTGDDGAPTKRIDA